METRAKAPAPTSYAVRLIGVNKAGEIDLIYAGTEPPPFYMLMKFNNCHSLLVEDNLGKIIKVK